MLGFSTQKIRYLSVVLLVLKRRVDDVGPRLASHMNHAVYIVCLLRVFARKRFGMSHDSGWQQKIQQNRVFFLVDYSPPSLDTLRVLIGLFVVSQVQLRHKKLNEQMRKHRSGANGMQNSRAAVLMSVG